MNLDKKFKDLIYDNFALGNECHRFGIISGCKPHCPVFERGECHAQKENELMFIEKGML